MKVNIAGHYIYVGLSLLYQKCHLLKYFSPTHHKYKDCHRALCVQYTSRRLLTLFKKIPYILLVTPPVYTIYVKARTKSEIQKFQDIPNVGPAMERDFILMEI